jgi:hypothetical protein
MAFSFADMILSFEEKMTEAKQYPSAAQAWLNTIPVMQQSVLFSGIRGMDGLPKLHPAKMLVRFYRRCVLISAFEGATITNPYDPGGGDFTGPSIVLHDVGQSVPFFTSSWHSEERARDMKGVPAFGFDTWRGAMQLHVDAFIRARDEMPLHYFSHMMHAFQIIGANHPNEEIRNFWQAIYMRMAHALHLWPETAEQLNDRLGDTQAGWKAREDSAGSCST